MTTPRELLDSFSDTLLADERILGPHEKELLASLLQHAGERNGVIGETISRAVGEVVARRAYDLLGESITRRLVNSAAFSGAALTDAAEGARQSRSIYLGPSPPSPGPRPPGPGVTPDFGPSPPSPGPHPPGPGAVPDFGPSPPSPGPRPPGPGVSMNLKPSPPSPGPRPPGPGYAATATAVAVMPTPAVRAAECVIFDEFLAPSELEGLLHFTLERENAFQISEVVSPGVAGTQVDYDHRRSRVLMDLGGYQELMVNRIQCCWPRVLEKLDYKPFEASDIEAQITASNDGDYFRVHSDNGQPENGNREITFVYFFHREPKEFRGGELRIYDSRWQYGSMVRGQNYRTIIPQQNQIVFFPSSLEHEITPVDCPSRAFTDSRFTVNGWFHR